MKRKLNRAEPVTDLPAEQLRDQARYLDRFLRNQLADRGLEECLADDLVLAAAGRRADCLDTVAAAEFAAMREHSRSGGILRQRARSLRYEFGLLPIDPLTDRNHH